MDIKLLSQANDDHIPVYMLKPDDEFFIHGLGSYKKAAYGKLIDITDLNRPAPAGLQGWAITNHLILRYDAYLPDGRKIHPNKPIEILVSTKDLRKLRSL